MPPGPFPPRPDPFASECAHAVAAWTAAPPPAASSAVVTDAAAMWNCPCRGQCSALAAVQCLYRATVDILGRGEGERDGNPALSPLGVVVSRQKSLAGQQACRRYAMALAAGDHATALSVCHGLIASEQERAAAGRR